MSLLFETLAKYVAKILLLIGVFTLLAISVDAQKKRSGKGKPKPSKVSKKYKKPTGKSTPRPKVQPRQSPSAKIALMPPPSHQFLHLSEDTWSDSVGIMSIFMFDRFNDGVIKYRLGTKPKIEDELLSINWDENTVFVDFDKTKAQFYPSGCFVVIYCKTHKLALFVQRIHCT